ncbi:hypothetical protein AB840_11315 [Megasphaera cerevisiae DSM 20462]|uniref:HNH nuclease domain-containing protein n=1 Tax=Megasphaera cerevisiae DSM 20462 TaxID=1122219 RepID=A0A0J6WTK1_9FIRM|nr:hypothetical protein AB840_11315 [Megasphaera cerevisiae DSM 20462]
MYSNNGKYASFLSDKYTRDDNTGYYLSSKLFNGKRKRLHIAVWEYFNGDIPMGYQIHHKDFNKNNNEISNLELKTVHDHLSLHAKLHTKEHVMEFHKKGIEAAKKWHASSDGSQWHKKRYDQMKDKLHQKIKRICPVCGNGFETTRTHENAFCSNNCRSAYRRRSGVDNEKRTCIICGNEFTTNKYSKAKTCSPKCYTKSRLQTMQNKKYKKAQ